MARYNVEYKERWACFSSIVDGFITPFMEKNDYVKWGKNEYNIDFSIIERLTSRLPINKAIFATTLNKDREDWLKHLSNLNLTKDEIDELILECEKEYYTPQYIDWRWRCPNCKSGIEWGYEFCPEVHCQTRLIWDGIEKF